MALHRLFVGLQPPPAIRARLLALMGGVAEARWQTDAQLHATLQFLGEVDRHRAEEVAARLSALDAAAVAVRLGGFGTFDAGQARRITALWIGLEPLDQLTELHRKVVRLMALAGIAPETRRYLPHVTLARFPARGVPPEALRRFLAANLPPAGGWEAGEVVLFESRLGRGGAHYEPVLRVPLRTAAAPVTGSSAGRRPPAP